jgi:2-amino-4-hydroxy-6-hydroxymethyldihydropteridine diphosphokinase
MCSEPRTPTRAFVGLGANLGDRRANIEAALAAVAATPGLALVRCTELIETPPWGVTDQPRFLNAVAEVRTTLEPMEMLRALKRIERELGRTESRRWGPREIDLDILLFGDRVIDDPALVVPHPHLTERPFVLAQLVALDASLVHPRLGCLLSVIELSDE